MLIASAKINRINQRTRIVSSFVSLRWWEQINIPAIYRFSNTESLWMNYAFKKL